jgi:hypothetical protein
MSSSSLLDITFGYGITWFICLYFVGAYIKLYFDKENKNNIVNLLIYIGITFLVILSRFVIIHICNRFGLELTDISNRIGFDMTDRLRFYQYNSITILLSSLFLFMFFKNLKINSEIITNCILKIAPLTFGVYLIHEQANFRPFIYNNILHTTDYLNSRYFIVIAIISVVSVFTVCIVIEYMRHNLAVYISKTKLYSKLEKYVIMKYKSINKEKMDEKAL